MRDENETKIGRRAAIKRSLLVLGAAAIAPTALAACGSSEQAGAANACGSTTNLNPTNLSTRTTNAYVDPGPDAAKHCLACALYVAPAGGAPCGTCALVKGPIATTGTCNAFAARPT